VYPAALELAWTAANEECAKRLVPFLPDLVDSLARHYHRCCGTTWQVVENM
jgi:hypothetical protein